MTNEEAIAYFEMRLSDTVRYANGKQTRQREAFELAVQAFEESNNYDNSRIEEYIHKKAEEFGLFKSERGGDND